MKSVIYTLAHSTAFLLLGTFCIQMLLPQLNSYNQPQSFNLLIGTSIVALFLVFGVLIAKKSISAPLGFFEFLFFFLTIGYLSMHKLYNPKVPSSITDFITVVFALTVAISAIIEILGTILNSRLKYIYMMVGIVFQIFGGLIGLLSEDDSRFLKFLEKNKQDIFGAKFLINSLSKNHFFTQSEHFLFWGFLCVIFGATIYFFTEKLNESKP
jgi:hypothetical protein